MPRNAVSLKRGFCAPRGESVDIYGPRSYVRNLERRLEQMEKLLHKVREHHLLLSRLPDLIPSFRYVLTPISPKS